MYPRDTQIVAGKMVRKAHLMSEKHSNSPDPHSSVFGLSSIDRFIVSSISSCLCVLVLRENYNATPILLSVANGAK